MKLLPEDDKCLMVHFTGIVLCLLALTYVLRPDLIVFVQRGDTFRTWPEIWMGLPLILLFLNVLYFFLERSIAGFLSVVSSSALLVYHYVTFPLVQQLVGSLP